MADFDEHVEYVDPGLPEPLHGVAAVRGFLESFTKAFPDAKMTIRNAIECDNSLAVEITWTGTHLGPLPMGAIPPTGKKVQVEGCDVFKIRDGKIVHLRAYLDILTLMAQLGLMPAPAGSVTAK